MVRIKKLYITRYGKFSNFSLDFDDGLNVIAGENEAGKSTIQSCIRAMLYGFSKKKKQIGVLRDRDRAIPWEGGKVIAAMTVNLDGRELEIRREFGKTAASDKILVVDISTGEEINELMVNDVGEKLFGMNETVFEKTVWIGQNDVYIGGSSEDITMRLVNLCQTGDADVSITKAMDNLNAKKAELKAKDKRSSDGEIDKLNKKRENLIQEKYNIQTMYNQRITSQNKIKELKATNLLFENDIEQLEKFKKAKEEQALTERVKQLMALSEKKDDIIKSENFQASEKIAEDDIKNAEELEKHILEINQSPSTDAEFARIKSEAGKHQKWKQRYIAGMGLSILIIIAGVILEIFEGPLLAIIVWIVGAFALITSIILNSRHKNIQNRLNEKINEYMRENAERIAKLSELTQRLNEILNKYNIKNSKEMRNIYNEYLTNLEKISTFQTAYDTLLGLDDFEELQNKAEQFKDMNYEALNLKLTTNKSIEELRDGIQKNLNEINDIENKVSYEYSGSENVLDVISEIKDIDAKLLEMQNKYKAVLMAIKVMENAYMLVKSDFTPQVNLKVNDILRRLTAEKHTNVLVAEDYKLQLLESDNKLLKAEYFSLGTYQQIYFALRLGIAQLINEKSEALFFDDLFMTYDEKRAKLAMDYIFEIAEECQVILFTCHKRDVNNAKMLNKVKIIEI
ncbi:MAG: AAA family ATPase [Oscillospiraceae bacterium]